MRIFTLFVSSSDADLHTFWCKNLQDFSKSMLCTHGQGGQFFAILCGRLLWTAPYDITKVNY